MTRLPVDKVGLFHPDAWKTLIRISDPQCKFCGVPLPYAEAEALLSCAECLAEPPVFSSARSALVYNDASKALVLAFKHGDQQHLQRHFVPLLKSAGAALMREDSLIVPVPLHPWRLLWRRYNQAAILAAGLSRATGAPLCLDGLVRIKATKPQGRFSAEARARNVRRAFTVPPRRRDSIKGRHIVLVDDVMTSGATFNACAETLLKAGAAEVACLSVMRAVKN